MNEELPEGWVELPFEDLIVELRNGISTRPNIDPPGTPILRISAARSGSVDLDDRRYLPGATPALVEAFRLRDRDLLFTRYNGSLDLVGVCGMVRGLGDAPVLYPDKLMRVRLNDALALPEYVELAFQAPSIRGAVMAVAKSSAGQQGISGADLKEQVVRLAPIAEQHRIVAQVEALLAEVSPAKEQIKRVPLILKNFRQAVVSAACSGSLTTTTVSRTPGCSRDRRGRGERGGARRRMLTVVAERAARQPLEKDARDGEADGGEGVDEVALRPRGGANGLHPSLDPRGEKRGHVRPRGTRTRTGRRRRDGATRGSFAPRSGRAPARP